MESLQLIRVHPSQRCVQRIDLFAIISKERKKERVREYIQKLVLLAHLLAEVCLCARTLNSLTLFQIFKLFVCSEINKQCQLLLLLL